MNDKVDILLVSDLHLGIKDDFFINNDDRVSAFNRIMDIAGKHDVLLIGGDFMDMESISEGDFNTVAESFQKLKESGKYIFYTPGFSELDSHGDVDEKLKKLNIDGIFCEKDFVEPHCVSKGEMNLFVYGFPASSNFNFSKISKINKEENKEETNGFHLALLHIDFAKERQKKDFDINVFDFFALGYNHNFKMYKLFDKIIAAHPGSPQALNLNEIGDRYALSIRISNTKSLKLKHVKVNTKRIVDEIVDCTEYIDTDALVNKTKSKIDNNDYVKLHLTGKRSFPLKTDILEELNDNALGFCIIDDSSPSVEALQLEAIGENTIKCEFLELLYDKINLGAVDEEYASNILRYVDEHKVKELGEWLCDISEH